MMAGYHWNGCGAEHVGELTFQPVENPDRVLYETVQYFPEGHTFRKLP
jgi:hypothetical protein